jgi:polyhydroxybutyrate depolymerase
MTQATLRLALTLTSALLATTAAADCNGQAGPCDLPNGTYHIVLPEGATGPVPAILLLHGYGGEGVGTIRNKPMVNLMLGRGYAVIAPP